MTIATAINIAAAPEKVWAVLTDFAGYAAWNPFITEASGNARAGAHISAFIRPPGTAGMRFRPRLLIVERDRELRWLGSVGVRGLFDGEHRFVLTPLPGGDTRFEQSERFSGLLAPLFTSRTFLAAAEEGFHAMNAALRDRVVAQL